MASDLADVLMELRDYPIAGTVVFAHAYDSRILICIGTTLHIDDELLSAARKCTGEKESTALVRLGHHE